MGNKWSAKRHNSTAAKDSSKGKTQTGWNDQNTSSSLSHTTAVNNLSRSVDTQPDTVTPQTDDLQLANDIVIYRSYSNVAQPEAEVELRSSSAGVRWGVTRRWVDRRQGVATRGYIGIYTPPNQSTLNFLCDCFISLTQDKLKLQWLANIYTHPNQIPGYASVAE